MSIVEAVHGNVDALRSTRAADEIVIFARAVYGVLCQVVSGAVEVCHESNCR